jgi:phosphoribosyl 1,2-cyclic phosphodiesterase
VNPAGKDQNIELTFLGTRGEIKARSRRHHRHSALLVQQGRARLMIDCGLDWLKALKRISPTAIVLTHAHCDHAFGLAKGAPCPVYATDDTWSSISRFPISDRRTVKAREPFALEGVRFQAFPVEHSIRAPAVGYRVTANRFSMFYVPDLAAICDQHEALRRVDLYVGDGATITRSMVRSCDHALIGHAPIVAQLAWCEKEGVDRAIFTHCGSAIVRMNVKMIEDRISQLGADYGVESRIAHDGLILRV